MINQIKNEERKRFEKEPLYVIQERLNACLQAIGHAKKEQLEFEVRARVLRQIFIQNNWTGERILFSICPMCDMVFIPKVSVCSNCGFSESDWTESVSN